MALSPGLAAARRLITIVCAALAVVAILGAVAYASGEAKPGCGSGWSATWKPLPSPLLTPEEVEVLNREKRNLYEAATEKGRPTRECRRAGARRLITSGVGALLILLPVGAILGYLYWPRREDMVIVLPDDEPAGPPPTKPDWAGR